MVIHVKRLLYFAGEVFSVVVVLAALAGFFTLYFLIGLFILIRKHKNHGE